MKTTNEQLLRNPYVQPSDEVIAEALGEINSTYVKFVNKLAHHDVQLIWRYYTDGKTWLARGLYNWTGARGGQNETTVFWLSIWDGFFRVTIYIPEKFRADALNLPLDIETKQMIENSKQMGKLKFFPIVFELNSNEMSDAIFSLIDFKKKVN